MVGADGVVLLVLGVAVLAVKVWALADAIYRPAPYFPAAGKWNKIGWVVVLLVAVLLTGANVLNLFGMIGVVAAVVYLVDVRPAVRALNPGSGGGSWR